ncbi:MAG: DUF1464 family protein [Gemmatimonadales bacterium]
MPRVIGIDPGTVSIDLCGLDRGKVWLDRTFPTDLALQEPASLLALLIAGGTPDLIAGPSGYGLPMMRGTDLDEPSLRLALLAPAGAEGGLGGLGRLMKAMAGSGLPVLFTPGVIHLSTVPAHRKCNRIDLGTADKVAVAALAVRDQALRLAIPPTDTSFILLELGGAFTAALAVERGAIVDGIGGTSGPMGWRSGGAWDGEVAILAGRVTKAMLFRGGRLGAADEPPALGHAAYVEGAHKAVLALMASVPAPREILLSGRHATDPEVRAALDLRLGTLAPVRRVEGLATVAKEGAQGAAVIADGLMGGTNRGVVEALRLREASGTALDHLRVITAAEARCQLGIS